MAQLPNIITKNRSAFRIFAFVLGESLRTSKIAFSLRVLFATLSTVSGLVQAAALGIVVNEFVVRGVTGARPAMLIFGIAAIVAFEFLPRVFDYLNFYFQRISADTLGLEVNHKMRKQIGILDMATIEQSAFKDKFYLANNRGTNSLLSVQNWTVEIIKYFFAVCLSAIAIAAVSPIVLVIVAVCSVPLFFIEKRSGDKSYAMWNKNTEKQRIMYSKIVAVSGSATILENKQNNSLDYFIDKIYSLASKFRSEEWVLAKEKTILDVSAELLNGASLGFAVWIIVKNILSGISSVGNFIFSVSAIVKFQSSIGTLLRSFGRIGEHAKFVNEMIDIIEMKPFISNPKNAKKLDIKNSESVIIEFKNVSFAYPGTEIQVLQNINFKLEQGKHLAVVGLNGAGKTTLTKLLSRIYDPAEGEILVNGINLKEYSLKSWQKHLSIMSQDYFVYVEESVKENIMLGDTKIVDEQRVTKSAQLSTAHDFIINFKDRYDQKIGTEIKGGVELSKGQKQKLVIARAWYRQAPFLILDEPTSAVDAVSEDIIFKNLFVNSEQFGAKPTIVVISHKFSNVRKADNIIVLEHGTIVEQGTHEMLIVKNGRYAELFKIQAEGFKN